MKLLYFFNIMATLLPTQSARDITIQTPKSENLGPKTNNNIYFRRKKYYIYISLFGIYIHKISQNLRSKKIAGRAFDYHFYFSYRVDFHVAGYTSDILKGRIIGIYV